MSSPKRSAPQCAARHAEHGFTLMEVMVSAAILVIGLSTMLGVFGMAVAATQSAQEDMIAKQVASEAMESIVTARNTSQVAWAQIQNVSNGGVFLDGAQPLLTAGPDGLDGTADDAPDPNPACPGPAKCLVTPGPDGILGTADDIFLPLNSFTRTIAIVPVPAPGGGNNPYLRQITITVQYTALRYKMLQKQYVMSAYISQFR